MAKYGLPLTDVAGISSYDDLRDPANALRMGQAMAARFRDGDVGNNLNVNGLMMNAYLMTGDERRVGVAGARPAQNVPIELRREAQRALYERGREISASDYQRAVALSQLVSRQIAAFFETYDAWFTPTLENPPLPLGQLDGRETDIEKAFAPIVEYS